MKNNFKSLITKTIGSDGTVNLSFETRRASTFYGGAQILTGFIAMMLAWIRVSAMMKMGVSDNMLIGTELVLAFFIYWGLSQFFFYPTAHIYVKPKQGIVFSGHELPMKDIRSFKVDTNPFTGAAGLFAVSGGRSIQVTPHTVPLEVANELAREVSAAIY